MTLSSGTRCYGWDWQDEQSKPGEQMTVFTLVQTLVPLPQEKISLPRCADAKPKLLQEFGQFLR